MGNLFSFDKLAVVLLVSLITSCGLSEKQDNSTFQGEQATEVRDHKVTGLAFFQDPEGMESPEPSTNARYCLLEGTDGKRLCQGFFEQDDPSCEDAAKKFNWKLISEHSTEAKCKEAMVKSTAPDEPEYSACFLTVDTAMDNGITKTHVECRRIESVAEILKRDPDNKIGEVCKGITLSCFDCSITASQEMRGPETLVRDYCKTINDLLVGKSTTITLPESDAVVPPIYPATPDEFAKEQDSIEVSPIEVREPEDTTSLLPSDPPSP